jgi:hypothetical protein
MTMATLSLIPDLVIFVTFQKYLVEGIATRVSKASQYFKGRQTLCQITYMV